MQVLEGKGIEIWQSSEKCGFLITLLSCSSKFILVECMDSQQSLHWFEPQSSQWKVAIVASDLQHNFSSQNCFELLVLNFLTLVML